MSNHFYKDKLYPLQDKVLRVIGTLNTPFYLTGGTVAGRFVLNHRYSDDLDFFINANPDFAGETKKVIDHLRLTFSDVRLNNMQDSFARILVVENDVNLKIEFVNDVKYRVGTPVKTKFGFLCDTWDNILSNKLTALSRVAPKDYADIFFLCLKFPFSWKALVEHAKQKDAWINEINISQQLINFDLGRLADVNFIENLETNRITSNHFKTLARESLHGFDNSLYGKKL